MEYLYSITREDVDYINKAYIRFCNLTNKNGLRNPYLNDKMSFYMDLRSVIMRYNANIKNLVDIFNDESFLHDIFGIYVNINRNTFPAFLDNNFLPRCC